MEPFDHRAQNHELEFITAYCWVSGFFKTEDQAKDHLLVGVCGFL